MGTEWTPLATVYDPLMAGSIDGTDTDAHDNGIIRAINAKYKPPKNLDSDPEFTLFVGRLSTNTTEDSIDSFFSSFGEIKHLHLVRDVVTGQSKRYAFVEFYDEGSIQRANRDAMNSELDGCEIIVQYECSRRMPGWIPRRLGGGFGGKKESGQLRFGGVDRPFRKPLTVRRDEWGSSVTENENCHTHVGSTSQRKSGYYDRSRDYRHRESYQDSYDDRRKHTYRDYSRSHDDRERRKDRRERSRERSHARDYRSRSRSRERDEKRSRSQRSYSRERSRSRERSSKHHRKHKSHKKDKKKKKDRSSKDRKRSRDRSLNDDSDNSFTHIAVSIKPDPDA